MIQTLVRSVIQTLVVIKVGRNVADGIDESACTSDTDELLSAEPINTALELEKLEQIHAKYVNYDVTSCVSYEFV